MNVPAIAKKSFDEFRKQATYINIVNFVVDRLAQLASLGQRAQFVHLLVDEYNQEVFSHPLVRELSPCKKGCSACCHTQVSVTEEEAHLLSQRIQNGASIDKMRLRLQIQAGHTNEGFLKLSYEDRRCIFLDKEGSCSVYEDRPSVCRTNAVLGSADQCRNSANGGQMVLVRTAKSDMAIYASFLSSKSSGTLPMMVGKLIGGIDS